MESYNKNVASATGFTKTKLLVQAETTNDNGFPMFVYDCGRKFRYQKVTSVNIKNYWDVRARYVQCHAFTRAERITLTRKQAYLLARLPEPSRNCRFL